MRLIGKETKAFLGKLPQHVLHVLGIGKLANWLENQTPAVTHDVAKFKPGWVTGLHYNTLHYSSSALAAFEPSSLANPLRCHVKACGRPGPAQREVQPCYTSQSISILEDTGLHWDICVEMVCTNEIKQLKHRLNSLNLTSDSALDEKWLVSLFSEEHSFCTRHSESIPLTTHF